MNLYKERMERIKAAVALEPVDKVPLISGGAAFNAAAAGVKMSDYLANMELNCTANIKATELMGNVDGIQAPLSSPEPLPTIWLSKIRVPGKDLPDNELWQVLEEELVTQQDYDVILEGGFESWYMKFMKEKLGDPISRMQPVVQYSPLALQRFADAGYPCIKGSTFLTPFEMLCGGRSLALFLMDDLIEIPDKLEQVFAKIHFYNLQRYERLLKSPDKPFGVWIGGWRGTPETLSFPMFERFSWRYMRELIDLTISYGVVPILHLDADWTRGLQYFKDIPRGKCIMSLDGKTDIFKAKETVGDTMCIMGDVPAQMLAFGKPETVYNYTVKLIKEIGPSGYMVCSGCDIPYNAKMENVQMMSKAIEDNAFVK